ncbi:hypothetical protein B0J11DRAFT_504607 [Dendryphion nanum]|uniref:Fungal STAND N-terminal Goodbye domain-containing protein n=1 Tax=Dendryphion nanum TaxID=256645 RepID=A0A9P9DZX3_9PLEO|nr:hypothetical protein B0J11DRAFT_504607 [Dendryphion nanum]
MGSGEKPASESDLGSLWKRAIIDYKSKTGYDLSHMKAASMDGIMQSAQDNLKTFQGKLHDKSKIDKVRTAFGNNLGGMQKCMNCIQAVGAAAGAFPPAMPVGLVFAACGRVLEAFAGVRADHDKVVAFFNQSTRFFERLSIIEGKVRKEGPLALAIMRVFSAQLSICAIAEVRMKEKNARIKAFMSALWTVEDPDLAASYGVMQVSIEELAQTVGYETYSSIKDTQTATSEVSAKADEIDEAIRQFRLQQTKDVRLLYDSNLDLKAEIGLMRSENRAGVSMIVDSQVTLHNDMKDFILKSLSSEREKTNTKEKNKLGAKGVGKGDAGDKKFTALRSIKSYFDDHAELVRMWKTAHKENTAQIQEMKDSFVDRTGEWLGSDPIFQQWIDGKNPLLWIRGPEGIGKSFLSHASLQILRSREESHASYAYFCFKEDFACLQSAQCAIACAAIQVAETNTRYAEQIAAKLKEDENNRYEISTWRRFFLAPFGSGNPTDSHEKLYLVLDGLDESSDQQIEVVREFLEELKNEKSRVHVLLTSRSDKSVGLEKLDPLIIEASKARMLPDIKILIWSRLQTLARLRKFSHAAKKIIRRKVAQQADGMLYVEHTLRRLSYIGREGAVVKALGKLPDNLHGLYKLMLDDCRRNRTPDQYEALKKLFAWLAFSKRPLSLSEASELIKVTIKDDDEFDIEDEIVGRSARILELARSTALDEDAKDDINEDKDEQDDDYLVQLDNYQKQPLTFQERSLRQYFRAVSVEAHGAEELRTPASVAQRYILTMCVDVLMKSAAASRKDEPSKLGDYVVKFWHDHFNELDPETLPDEEISEVLPALYKLVTNQKNVAKQFELFATVPAWVYPVEEEADASPWYVRLEAWAKKSESLPADALNPEVKEWLAGITANPKSVLGSLARGHVSNWLSQYHAQELLDGYTYAEATLKIMGLFESTDDKIKDCLSVADAFGEHKETGLSCRAIGTRIMDISYEAADDDSRKQLQTGGIPYLTKAIELAGDDNLLKALVYRTFTRLYQQQKEYQTSIEFADKSIACFEQSASEQDPKVKNDWKLNYWVYYMYIYKAECYLDGDNKEDALRMYKEARRTTGDDDILEGAELESLTRTLDETTDPDGTRLMAELKDWTEKERHLWFNWSFEWWTEETSLARMFRAAHLTGETAILLDWFAVYERTLPPRSLLVFNIKAATADFYHKKLKDLEKAKQFMRAALTIQPQLDTDYDYVFHHRISYVRLNLAGLVFEEFRTSLNPTLKETCLDSMKALLPGRADQDLRESHIDMLIANMLRIIGPAREYQKCMDQIFKACIDGLEDGVSWNDGDSLRLLAKVLSSLDGLEKDARIAISAQFSVLDRTIFDSEKKSQAGSENGETEEPAQNGDSGETESPAQDGENAEAKANGEVTEGQDVPATTEGGTPVDLANGTHAFTEPTKETEKPKTDSPQLEDFSDVSSKTTEAPNGTAGDDSIATPDATTEQSQPAPETAPETDADGTTEATAPDSNDPIADKDKEDICDYSIGCDGACGTSISSWTQPIYLCLICPNVDLCEDCHTKRRVPGSDLPYCAENHHYVKGPIKGWRGVKDGVIRIGEEEIKVKEWIRGLKEERWQKAWEKYWGRQGGLKDIGDD